MHTDDGIVLTLPDTDGEPPTADLVVFDADEIEPLVTAEVSGSALFASRFRECAGRSLLLPRRDPRQRTALWQQRQRAHQLLQVASEYGDFPVVLEAMRECLQDVFDVPGLRGLMRDLAHAHGAARRGRDRVGLAVRPVAAVRLRRHVPLRGRRAAGRAAGAGAVARPGAAGRAARLDRAARAARRRRDRRRSKPSCSGWPPSAGPTGIDAVARPAALARRPDARPRRSRAARPRQILAELEATRRAIRVRIAGDERWLAIEDAGRVRDALGAALPVGVPEAFTEPVRDPLGDLVARYARTHGPFHLDAGRRPARARARGRRGRARAAAGERPGRPGRVPPGRAGQRVVRRRGAAHDPAPLAGRAAPRGRAGVDPDAGPVRAGLAGRRACATRPAARRAAARHRAAGRRADPGQRARIAGPARRGSPTTRPRCSTS